MPTDQEITELLRRWSSGDTEAFSELVPLIVDDLRRLARGMMAHESPAHTLEPTALVNEVYLRLSGRRTVTWKNRAQFFVFMGNVMRRVLVDHARSHRTAKRGAGLTQLPFDEAFRLPDGRDPDLVSLDDALESLTAVDPRQGRIVEMRYFAGLTTGEIAEAEGISSRTVKRDWQTARLYLMNQLRDA